MKRFLLLIAIVVTAACIKIPPIVVPPSPPPVVVPAPEPAPAPEPEPPEPAPEPAPEPPPVVELPWRDLNLRVFNQQRRPIPGALVSTAGEQRTTDGNGFANFGVKGSTVVTVTAADCAGERRDVPPGDHEFNLICALPVPLPLPPPVTPVPPSLGFACNTANNTWQVSDRCLMAVASVSKDYELCTRGNGVACHRYVREVVHALRSTTGDPGWGLLSKPFGQQACNLTECGRNVSNGYGEDMVAYLPKGNPVHLWTGIDVIIGAGAPGAKFGGGILPAAVGGRPDNLWAPVP